MTDRQSRIAGKSAQGLNRSSDPAIGLLVLDFKIENVLRTFLRRFPSAGFFNAFPGFQVTGIEKDCLSNREQAFSRSGCESAGLWHKGRDTMDGHSKTDILYPFSISPNCRPPIEPPIRLKQPLTIRL